MVDEVLKSYKRWTVQMAREFNVKADEIEDIIKVHYDLAKS